MVEEESRNLTEQAKKIYDEFKYLCSDPETPEAVKSTLKALKSIADYKLRGKNK